MKLELSNKDQGIFVLKLDKNNICQFCKMHDEMENDYPLNEFSEINLQKIADKTGKEISTSEIWEIFHKHFVMPKPGNSFKNYSLSTSDKSKNSDQIKAEIEIESFSQLKSLNLTCFDYILLDNSGRNFNYKKSKEK